MRKLMAWVLVGAAGAASAGVAPNAGGEPDALKCAQRVGGDPDMPEIVLILDDEVYPGDASTWDHEAYDVYWANIVCWSWVEEHFGVQTRSGATYVVTEEWMENVRASRLASLEALAAAQERHRRDHGAFADDVGDLAGFGPLTAYGLPAYAEIALSEDAGRWSAELSASDAWEIAFVGGGPFATCYAGAPPAEDVAPDLAPEARATLADGLPVCLS